MAFPGSPRSLPSKRVRDSSEADLGQLAKNFADPSIQGYAALARDLSAACRTCVLSQDVDHGWALIVSSSQSSGASGFINLAACYERVEGHACGESVQFETFCSKIACSECATTDGAYAICIEAAAAPGGMCSTFRSDTTASCPKLGESSQTCVTVVSAARKFCGTQ